MGIAFDNYIHTLARNAKKIELRVRAYDRVKQARHEYFSGVMEPTPYLNEGRSKSECLAVMAQLRGARNVDYWYPMDRCLGTIDSIAKVAFPGTATTERTLIQITKSDRHSINASKLDVYAHSISGTVRYIALVPDKRTCVAFRLDPTAPSTRVPLYVGYVQGWEQLPPGPAQ